jgi:hypothetical protein
MPRKGKQIGEKGNPKAERLVGTKEKVRGKELDNSC